MSSRGLPCESKTLTTPPDIPLPPSIFIRVPPFSSSKTNSELERDSFIDHLARTFPVASRKMNSFASTVFLKEACPMMTSKVTAITVAALACLNLRFWRSSLATLLSS
jgi:hypothetical protein